MASRPTKQLFRLHSWLGLVTGLFILLVSLSGAALVYVHELDRWWHADQLRVMPTGARLPIDTLVARLRERFPTASGGALLATARRPDEALAFRLYGTGRPITNLRAWDLYQVDMDPFTGRIMREGNHRDLALPLQWLHTFHYSMHAGTWGIALLALVCLALLTSLLTGLVVFRRHLLDALLFRIPVRGGGARRALSGLHRLVGVWSLILTALIFYSGLEMNWGALTPAGWELPANHRRLEPPLASLDAMLSQTEARWPGFRVQYLVFPFEAGDSVRISGDIPGTPSVIQRGASGMSFDPVTGAGSARDINHAGWTEQLSASTYSFHVGTFAGEWSRAAYVVIGLLPGLLSVTGFTLWLARSRRVARRAERPQRTAQRAVRSP